MKKIFKKIYIKKKFKKILKQIKLNQKKRYSKIKKKKKNIKKKKKKKKKIVLHTDLVSVHLAPLPSTHTRTNIFFSNLDPFLSKFTRELKIRVKGLYLKVY